MTAATYCPGSERRKGRDASIGSNFGQPNPDRSCKLGAAFRDARQEGSAAAGQ